MWFICWKDITDFAAFLIFYIADLKHNLRAPHAHSTHLSIVLDGPTLTLNLYGKLVLLGR